ncbi:MAG TPA: biotin-dependent carboxyltransferase family protein [Methylomirabilota bacterium]|nr:biotin-dependent carboxyltransferase family protein [Methylomirabilota bacterium]
MSGLAVIEPGLLTTVQDLGRLGYQRVGIPPSGPMDRAAFVVANRLVGNPDGAAGLECTLNGPRLEVRQPALVAVTGAEMEPSLNGDPLPTWTAVAVAPGDVLAFRMARAGCRAYLAVAGGLDVAPVLGSRATYLRGRLGGLGGRALQKGDVLPVGRPAAAGWPGRTVPPALRPAYPAEVECRVILGPQADRFTADGIAAFLGAAYEVTPQADRMGYRLKGPLITHARGHDIVSDGIPLGGIQVPGEGQPIVLLVDRQTTGGYTKIATVIGVDIGRIGQTRPGQRVRFREVGLEEAHAALADERRWLAHALES